MVDHAGGGDVGVEYRRAAVDTAQHQVRPRGQFGGGRIRQHHHLGAHSVGVFDDGLEQGDTAAEVHHHQHVVRSQVGKIFGQVQPRARHQRDAVAQLRQQRPGVLRQHPSIAKSRDADAAGVGKQGHRALDIAAVQAFEGLHKVLQVRGQMFGKRVAGGVRRTHARHFI
ncbi:hypothetical protein D3C72_1679290 [compost metagenome]